MLLIQTGDGERTQAGSKRVPTGCAMNMAEVTERRSSLALTLAVASVDDGKKEPPRR